MSSRENMADESRQAWHRGFRWGCLAGAVTVALAVCVAALK